MNKIVGLEEWPYLHGIQKTDIPAIHPTNVVEFSSLNAKTISLN